MDGKRKEKGKGEKGKKEREEEDKCLTFRGGNIKSKNERKKM